MTRKDYRIIAECIRKSLKHFENNYTDKELQGHMAIATAVIIRHLQEGLKQDNPNFKNDVFYKACAIMQEV